LYDNLNETTCIGHSESHLTRFVDLTQTSYEVSANIITIIYTSAVRSILFWKDPEQTHLAAHKAARNFKVLLPAFKAALVYRNDDLLCDLFGTTVSNPLGLAAGFDKNGDLVDIVQHVGFGFAEVGSVTALSKEGNPKPRLFRLESDEAVINRMGLNGEGADAVAAKLARSSFGLPTGLNIAKTNDPSITGDAAVQDILFTFNRIKSLPLTYVTINVSCPNTKEGVVSEAAFINTVLAEVQNDNTAQLPILLKLSPDSTEDLLEQMVDTAAACKISGFVCGNTSTGRENLKTDSARIQAIGAGGLSGPPLRAKALKLCKTVHALKQPSQIIIGCGGINSGDVAYDFIASGASFLQLYTGLVYEGPSLPMEICKRLSAILKERGQTLKEAVGSGQHAPAIK
jgi:dihydroorotate dehydrogenase